MLGACAITKSSLAIFILPFPNVSVTFGQPSQVAPAIIYRKPHLKLKKSSNATY
jgi:hypothetical protein